MGEAETHIREVTTAARAERQGGMENRGRDEGAVSLADGRAERDTSPCRQRCDERESRKERAKKEKREEGEREGTWEMAPPVSELVKAGTRDWMVVAPLHASAMASAMAVACASSEPDIDSAEATAVQLMELPNEPDDTSKPLSLSSPPGLPMPRMRAVMLVVSMAGFSLGRRPAAVDCADAEKLLLGGVLLPGLNERPSRCEKEKEERPRPVAGSAAAAGSRAAVAPAAISAMEGSLHAAADERWVTWMTWSPVCGGGSPALQEHSAAPCSEVYRTMLRDLTMNSSRNDQIVGDYG